jgi:hypothetical protein
VVTLGGAWGGAAGRYLRVDHAAAATALQAAWRGGVVRRHLARRRGVAELLRRELHRRQVSEWA